MKIDFDKYADGLVPAIVQDAQTKTVLMLGYMNAEALAQTKATNKVTFYSRSKKRLWMKGEASGHILNLVDIKADCDNDALLVSANPKGPTCHTGSDTCWNMVNTPSFGFISELEATIASRIRSANTETSYVASLFAKGLNKIAQKVGEEAVEMVIEAKDDNNDLFLEESADLLFHYLMLLQAKGFRLADVVKVLEGRH